MASASLKTCCHSIRSYVWKSQHGNFIIIKGTGDLKMQTCPPLGQQVGRGCSGFNLSVCLSVSPSTLLFVPYNLLKYRSVLLLPMIPCKSMVYIIHRDDCQILPGWPCELLDTVQCCMFVVYHGETPLFIRDTLHYNDVTFCISLPYILCLWGYFYIQQQKKKHIKTGDVWDLF